MIPPLFERRVAIRTFLSTRTPTQVAEERLMAPVWLAHWDEFLAYRADAEAVEEKEREYRCYLEQMMAAARVNDLHWA